MQTKQEDTSNTPFGIEKTHKEGSPSLEMNRIEGTPFTHVIQDGKHFLVMGDDRVTEPTETAEQTLAKLETEKWLLITHIAVRVNKIAQQDAKIDKMTDRFTEADIE